jgi:hypothetical protein
MRRDGYADPIFPKDVTIRGKSHKGVIPLQAADMLAHISFESTRAMKVGDEAILPYPDLDRVHGELSAITNEDFKRHRLETWSGVAGAGGYLAVPSHSTETGAPWITSRTYGDAPVRRPACLGSCSMIYDVQPCGTWCGPASPIGGHAGERIQDTEHPRPPTS